MRPDEVAATAPGQVIRVPEGYWTFVPNRLPPELTYSTSLVRQLSEADRSLGELAGIGRMLPNPHLLIRPFMSREAVLSSRIEGTVTRLDQLLLFEAQPEDENAQTKDMTEVVNYVRALEYGLEQLRQGMPLCLRLIRAIHERLLEGVRGQEKRPGEFRRCPVFIGRSGQSFLDARFVPPYYSELDSLLRDFETFLNEPGDVPLTVQLAVVHYQFETIHPFMDGNGRIGRLLTMLMLCERGCLPHPLLYLSAYLERHDREYKDHLLEVSRRGAWAEWIEFFARGVAEQANDAARRSRNLLELWKNYRRRMQETSQSSAVLHLVDELFASPFMTIPGIAKLLDITYRAAKLNVEKLLGTAILKETSPRKKTNRVYYAPAILDQLSADTAPNTLVPAELDS
jgi:Fic family protein